MILVLLVVPCSAEKTGMIVKTSLDLTYAWSVMLLISVGYALVDSALSVSGATPTQPFLHIPPGKYKRIKSLITLLLVG